MRLETDSWIAWFKSLDKIKRNTVCIDYCLGEKVFTQGYVNQRFAV